MSFDDTHFIQPVNLNKMKRVSINPESPMEKISSNEIGIRSSVKGREIRDYINRAIYKLVNLNMRTITLKAIGNACNKLLSISDIIRRKIKDLNQINHTYSRKYIAKYESEDGKEHVEKEFRLPCLDVTLSIDPIDSKTPGYVPILPESELENDFIDPSKLDKNFYYYKSRAGRRQVSSYFDNYGYEGNKRFYGSSYNRGYNPNYYNGYGNYNSYY